MSNFLISCKESRIETNRSFYSSFVIGPFNPSESITVATALRRTLLSELSGVAIVSVQIEGAAHEYSNLPGIRDSVLDILLNLREVVLKKSIKIIRPQIGYLRARGPGVVVAGDLVLPPFIQCVDPKQHIATLAEDGVLNMKFIISEGKNYIKGKPKMMIDIYQYKRRRSILKKLSRACEDSSLLNQYYNYLKVNKKRNLLNHPKFARTTVFAKKRGSTNSSKNEMNFSKIKKNSLSLNILNVDAVFNPVLNVNYIIEINEHQILENLFEKTNKIERDLAILQTPPLIDTNISQNFDKTNLENQFKRAPLGSDISYLKKLLKYQINLDRFSKNTGQNNSQNSISLKKDQAAKMILEHFENESQIQSDKIWSSDGQKDHVFHNNIILEVWTNGSLHPREAVYEAFKHLVQLFSKLQKIQSIEPLTMHEVKNIDLVNYLKTQNELNSNSVSSFPLNHSTFIGKYGGIQPLPITQRKQISNDPKQKLAAKKEIQRLNKSSSSNLEKSLEKLEFMDISILKISLRSLMALKKRNVNTIADLIQLTKEDLVKIPYIGDKSIHDIEQSLLKIGFGLKETN